MSLWSSFLNLKANKSWPFPFTFAQDFEGHTALALQSSFFCGPCNGLRCRNTSHKSAQALSAVSGHESPYGSRSARWEGFQMPSAKAACAYCVLLAWASCLLISFIGGRFLLLTGAGAHGSLSKQVFAATHIHILLCNKLKRAPRHRPFSPAILRSPRLSIQRLRHGTSPHTQKQQLQDVGRGLRQGPTNCTQTRGHCVS